MHSLYEVQYSFQIEVNLQQMYEYKKQIFTIKGKCYTPYKAYNSSRETVNINQPQSLEYLKYNIHLFISLGHEMNIKRCKTKVSTS